MQIKLSHMLQHGIKPERRRNKRVNLTVTRLAETAEAGIKLASFRIKDKDIWGIIDDEKAYDQAMATRVVIGGKGLGERDGVGANWFDRQQCVAALVRPDHYVYTVLKSLDELCPVLRDLSDQHSGSPGVKT
jgi:hypothetical protein